jgi:hypothetical protein
MPKTRVAIDEKPQQGVRWPPGNAGTLGLAALPLEQDLRAPQPLGCRADRPPNALLRLWGYRPCRHQHDEHTAPAPPWLSPLASALDAADPVACVAADQLGILHPQGPQRRSQFSPNSKRINRAVH